MPDNRLSELLVELRSRKWRLRLNFVPAGNDPSWVNLAYVIECAHGAKYGRGIRLQEHDNLAETVLGAADMLIDSALKTIPHIEKDELENAGGKHSWGGERKGPETDAEFIEATFA